MASHHQASSAASLALIASADRQAGAEAWMNGVLSFWPGTGGGGGSGHRPAVTMMALDPSIEGVLAAARPFDAAVVAPGPDVQPAVLDRLIADLTESLTPTLVLTDPLGGGPLALSRLASPNVLVQSPAVEPAAVATLLGALAARQPSVRALQGQLRVAQSLEGGIYAQIERINDELLLAAHVQREFLPKHLPQVPGLDVGVIFRPAGFVSGDMYDLARLDEHHVGFYIADAMGHGLPAALMTLFIAAHLNLKQYSPGEGPTIVRPADALTRLNAALYAARAGPSRFVSAICGVIDSRDGTVTLACAGHPRPLRIGASGAEAIDVSGTLLGILDDSTYDQVTLRLRPGETLVLHSDGVNAPTREEPERFLDAPDPDLRGPFEQRAAEPPNHRSTVNDALAIVERNLDGRTGSFHQGDDISVLAIAVSDRVEADAAPAAPAHAGHAAQR